MCQSTLKSLSMFINYPPIQLKSKWCHYRGLWLAGGKSSGPSFRCRVYKLFICWYRGNGIFPERAEPGFFVITAVCQTGRWKQNVLLLNERQAAERKQIELLLASGFLMQMDLRFWTHTWFWFTSICHGLRFGNFKIQKTYRHSDCKNIQD